MAKYYARQRVMLPEFERLMHPAEMLEVVEADVKNMVRRYGPPVRAEWKAVGPSDIREGETRSVPWTFGDKIPYWAQWLEFWAYTWSEGL